MVVVAVAVVVVVVMLLLLEQDGVPANNTTIQCLLEPKGQK
jgi:hypothetical protein